MLLPYINLSQTVPVLLRMNEKQNCSLSERKMHEEGLEPSSANTLRP